MFKNDTLNNHRHFFEQNETPKNGLIKKINIPTTRISSRRKKSHFISPLASRFPLKLINLIYAYPYFHALGLSLMNQSVASPVLDGSRSETGHGSKR